MGIGDEENRAKNGQVHGQGKGRENGKKGRRKDKQKPLMELAPHPIGEQGSFQEVKIGQGGKW